MFVSKKLDFLQTMKKEICRFYTVCLHKKTKKNNEQDGDPMIKMQISYSMQKSILIKNFNYVLAISGSLPHNYTVYNKPYIENV